MDNSTPVPPEETPLPLESLETETTKSEKLQSSEHSTSLEINAERIKSSVARLSSNSIDELQALVSELQKMQTFLKSEVDRVQIQIDSALAGINIIIETIRPWKGSRASTLPPSDNRSARVMATEHALHELRGLHRS